MQRNPLGSTGLSVSILGLGGAELGRASLSEAQAERTVAAALEAGLNCIDTALGYGELEPRLGRCLGARRPEVVLATKVGYGVPGQANWSYGAVALGIDESLRRLRTDWLDIVHLHSCDLRTLQRGEVIWALQDAQQAGKVRVAGYCGENEALAWAVASGHFQCIQSSVSLADQRGLEGLVPQAAAQGCGVMAKRAVANAPWRFAERPYGDYAEEYWYRWRTLGLDPRGLDWQELAVRFVAYAPGVHTALIGMDDPAHVHQNAAYAAKGPLPEAQVEEIRQAFRAHDEDWLGLT